MMKMMAQVAPIMKELASGANPIKIIKRFVNADAQMAFAAIMHNRCAKFERADDAFDVKYLMVTMPMHNNGDDVFDSHGNPVYQIRLKAYELKMVNGLPTLGKMVDDISLNDLMDIISNHIDNNYQKQLPG